MPREIISVQLAVLSFLELNIIRLGVISGRCIPLFDEHDLECEWLR